MISKEEPQKPVMARISTAVLSFTIFIIVMAWVSELVSNQWIAIHQANAAYQKNAEYDRDKSADEIAEDCQDPDVVFRDCVRKNLESHYQDQATNKDLQAQQDMAFWAFWLLVASAVGIGISGFGVLLLIRSIDLGREANVEATKAANAAAKANDIMRQEQRPWLIMKATGPFKKLASCYRSDLASKLRIKATNRGRTPAQDAVATYITFSHDTMRAKDVGDMVEAIFLEHFDLYACATNTVFQDEEATVPVVPLPNGMRTIGSGNDWSIMIVCLYHWDGDVKQNWIMQPTKRPPENVLKHQKT